MNNYLTAFLPLLAMIVGVFFGRYVLLIEPSNEWIPLFPIGLGAFLTAHLLYSEYKYKTQKKREVGDNE
jgi:uncharacterized membrane protein YhhN